MLQKLELGTSSYEPLDLIRLSLGLNKLEVKWIFLKFSLEFYGIDMWMLKKALSQLEAKGKAQMFEAPDASDESGLGVKFFS